MNIIRSFSILIIISSILPSIAFTQKVKDPAGEKADWRVDNNGYWKKMAEKRLVTLNPVVDVPKASYTGSEIETRSSATLDSPDVPVATNSSEQSENSVFINPTNNQHILNSNNSVANPQPPIYGADYLYSYDGGATWQGQIEGVGGIDNSGDPAVVIGNNGWYYINSISEVTSGQQLAYSDDQGASWNIVDIDDASSAILLDKNHFWIDNILDSPYEGNLYCAWTDFGGPHNENIALSYSSDQGISWSTAVNISSAVDAGSHCQGVNINTGPNGEVYAVYAIYDGFTDENAYGLSKSLDGGASWEPATRIIEDTKGIRSSETSKEMRVNSFPVLAVDVSNGPYNGNLYMVWCNIGEPGINTGEDIDIYMIRSEDQGDTWSAPIRVNQDPSELGKEHYFPWITCDPITGDLSVIFYDDRNVSSTECEVFCANSVDGGNTWEDFKVSDVSFTPSPMPGTAPGYMGDYLGITARDSYVYPCWTDNRTGTAMTYVSPYEMNSLSRPSDLNIVLNEENGSVNLDWQYDMSSGFVYFKVYRNNVEIAQPATANYTDQLPDHGIYNYKVTAFYNPEGESIPTSGSVQWGNPHIFVAPLSFEQTLAPDSQATQYLSITNIGELDLQYKIYTTILNDKDSKSYCSAGAECDEYIGLVEFGDINNTSSCSGGYEDYTSLSTSIASGETIPITVTNGSSWEGDVCGIWIDWNQNEDFTDDEPITVSGGPEVFTANITCPENAVGGTTRMRLRIQYFGTPEPCGNTDWGEVEDYSVNVISWLTIDKNNDIILPGVTDQIAVSFDATDMLLGEYYAEFSVTSNDPDLPEVIVPIHMIVSEFGVMATATPSVVCLGDGVQLDCDVFGGGGNYAYTWTSDPPGFNSTLQSPVVIPAENTIYVVQATDGPNTGSGQVSVFVNEIPTVNIGPDTSMCHWEVHIFDAGPGFSSYEWQDGSSGQTFTATESGEYWVEVKNEFGCLDVDSALLTVMEAPVQPAMPAGPSVVDLYLGNLSTYQTTLFPAILNYQWELVPETAGNILNNGYEATIEWDEEFTGEATLKVMATNNCGSSIWSDNMQITVLNTTGLSDLEKNLDIDIYPNPNKGAFTLELSSETSTYINIHIYNSNLAIVYQLDNVLVTGQLNKKIDLSGLAKGVYSLSIESKNGKLSRQVIIGD